MVQSKINATNKIEPSEKFVSTTRVSLIALKDRICSLYYVTGLTRSPSVVAICPHPAVLGGWVRGVKFDALEPIWWTGGPFHVLGVFL